MTDFAGWNTITNSAYVGKVLSTSSCEACRSACLADDSCTYMTYNDMLGECSLNHGEGPLREMAVEARLACMGISSAYKECPDTDRTSMVRRVFW